MAGTPISRADLPELARKDALNVVPTLIVLSAIDPQFPDESSWLYEYLSRSPYGTLWIDLDEMRKSGMLTGATRALVDLAHDIWNGDVKTPVNDVLHRCDRPRVARVINALIASHEGGEGVVSRKFMAAVATAAPTSVG